MASAGVHQIKESCGRCDSKEKTTAVDAADVDVIIDADGHVEQPRRLFFNCQGTMAWPGPWDRYTKAGLHQASYGVTLEFNATEPIMT